ncbi:MAG: hypothetical protein A2V86_04270 [Deltaproteobacteria bacterium RBG_16_49_23]|nr:MAG: hypothetical protein A2V86_04270 [Deltaproteobacteria bacterium RBG_16_49_23]
MMKKLYKFIAVMGIICTCINIFDFSRMVFPNERVPTEERPSANYLEALQTANAFLLAWVMRDAEVGLRLLSDHLRGKVNNDAWLRQFIVGLSNPHHQAFEIEAGRKLSDTRFIFSVTLYELYSGENMGFAYKGVMEVVKQGNVWRVDRLPRSSDNPNQLP